MDVLYSSGLPIVQSGVRLEWTMPLLSLTILGETVKPIASPQCTLKACIQHCKVIAGLDCALMYLLICDRYHYSNPVSHIHDYTFSNFLFFISPHCTVSYVGVWLVNCQGYLGAAAGQGKVSFLENAITVLLSLWWFKWLCKTTGDSIQEDTGFQFGVAESDVYFQYEKLCITVDQGMLRLF